MALNIGNLTFGIDANTAGIRKAITAIGALQKATDKLARKQSAEAKKQVSALLNREKALRSAVRETLNLRRAQTAAKAPNEQILRTTLALKVLTTQLARTKVSQTTATRAVDDFKDKINRGRRELALFNREAKTGQTGLSKYSILLRDLESSAVLALGPLSGLGARIRSIGAIISRGPGNFSKIFLGLAIGAVAATIALAKLGSAAVRAGSEFKSLELRFTAATGSAAASKKEMKFVIGIAKSLGLEITGLAKSYTRFIAASQGTSIEGAKSRIIFTQISRAAAALKLSAADVEGVMRAVEQIMSKGTVQAEELRGQLGDRLPGAFRIASEAMGVSTRELNRMLKAGEVMSDEFLPKFARQLELSMGRSAEQNLNTLSGAFALANTNLTLLLVTVDEMTGLSEGVTKAIRVAAEAFDLFNEGLEKAQKLAKIDITAGILPGQFFFRVRKATEDIGTLTSGIIIFREELKSKLNVSSLFADLNDDIKDDLRELTNLNLVMDKVRTMGTGAETTLDFFEKMSELAKLSADDLLLMSEHLSLVTGKEVEANVGSIAEAWAFVAEKLRLANIEFDLLKDAPEAIKEADEALAELKERIRAISEGPAAEQAFDAIASDLRSYVEVLKEAGFEGNELARRTAEYIAGLKEQNRLELQNAETKKALTAATKARNTAADRLYIGVLRAIQALEMLREQNVALASGPESFEYFRKVLAPMAKMEQLLLKAGVDLQIITEILKQYKVELETNLAATDKWARANQKAADAMVNGLERVILEGESVTDMLNNLAKELLRVAIRALFLDKLKNTLFNIFQGGGFPGVIKPPSAPIPTGGTKGLAHGGPIGAGEAKIIGEKGKELFVPGVSGTVIPNNKLGGNTVIINQENNFNGAFADPSVFIPLLEENNQKLKGEILDGFDRGSFA